MCVWEGLPSTWAGVGWGAWPLSSALTGEVAGRCGGRWHFSRPSKDSRKGTDWRAGRTSALRPAGCPDLASFLAGTEGAWLQVPTVLSLNSWQAERRCMEGSLEGAWVSLCRQWGLRRDVRRRWAGRRWQGDTRSFRVVAGAQDMRCHGAVRLWESDRTPALVCL